MLRVWHEDQREEDQDDAHWKGHKDANNKSGKLSVRAGHCKIDGNEKADRLAREGYDLKHLSDDLSRQNTKHIIKSHVKERWESGRPHHNRQGGLRRMDRQGQTNFLRPRTGYKLKAHLFKTYKIDQTDLCSRGQASETAEHIILQDSHNYRTLRQAIWSSPIDVQTKLWGTLEELEKTNTGNRFIYQTGGGGVNNTDRHRDQEEEDDEHDHEGP
ncbi:hypothetical protein ElyMa_006871600 [Elysia marginata]|uniref:RNase H type-1 domain-containing protein n=1 Tax=Elysia marginata TaxID=1093978 RepID=A0AAV4JAP0_9GAST|nr:hypothetical protein ElyMa_006871600 [Elysia marginata]